MCKCHLDYATRICRPFHFYCFCYGTENARGQATSGRMYIRLPQMPGFNVSVVRVGFVVDQVTFVQVFPFSASYHCIKNIFSRLTTSVDKVGPFCGCSAKGLRPTAPDSEATLYIHEEYLRENVTAQRLLTN
jgi:hypothetical protein